MQIGLNQHSTRSAEGGSLNQHSTMSAEGGSLNQHSTSLKEALCSSRLCAKECLCLRLLYKYVVQT